MDPETQLDAVRNVGIRDGRIEAITTAAIRGEEVINAAGKVVAPGFIDTHVHALDGLTVRLRALDGVTTGMDLEVGAYNVGEWYAQKKDSWPINYGTTVSQEIVRMVVHDPEVGIEGPVDATRLFELRGQAGVDGEIGWSEHRSDLAEMNTIGAHLDEGLRQGALGVGSTVGYASRGISSYEMFEAQRVAARYGRLTAVHLRFHANGKTPTEATLSFDEVFANAALLGAPLLVTHNNDYGWWEIEEKLELAREQGMNMWSEYYPYESASTSIGSDFLRPESLEGVFGLKYEETIFDPDVDKFLSKEEYLETAAADPGRVVILFNPARRAWMPSWLRIPHMTVASDAMWAPGLSWDDDYTKYRGHPRTAGTHGRVLRLARDAGVPLMFTLSQMSYWPAKHLGDAGVESMLERGRMQVGMVADITIFDPQAVTDMAGYGSNEQGLPTSGISWVIVNGQVVVRNSEFERGVRAGQPIRYAIEPEGRFQPVTELPAH